MTSIDPADRLAVFVQAHGTQDQAARKLGISQQYLSDLLKNRRQFSSRILQKLGLKAIIVNK